VHRVVFLTIALSVAASFAVAGSPATVDVVLDASASMNRAGSDGSPIDAVVRESMAAVLAEAAALQPRLTIGLRVAGGGGRTESLGSCSVTDLVVPLADLEPDRWFRTLDAIKPSGLRPLFAAVLAAVVDLEHATGQRRIVIVTSGDDQCGLGPQQVAAALSALDRPVDLRIVGLALDQGVADRFGAVPFRNSATAEELLTSLRWAILDIEDPVRPAGTLVLELSSDSTDPIVARVDLVDSATGEETTNAVTDTGRVDVAAGRYRLTITPQPEGSSEFRGLLILPGTETRLALDPGAGPVAAVDVGSDPVVVGAPIWIDVAGDVPDGAHLLFVDANGRSVSRSESPFANDGWTVSPPLAGPLDLLLMGPEEQGVRPVLAARSFVAVASKPSFTVPESLGIGEELVVDLSDPHSPGDFIGLVPRAGTPTDTVSCVETGVGVHARLTAPPEEAELDLIYVEAATMSVAARHPLQITAPQATVEAPARTEPGETIEVVWRGPENDEDFLSLARADSPDGAYVEWARAEDGSPAVFRAPDSPGAYEARYVDGRTGEVRARTPVEVAAVPVELSVPTTARCGRRFEVVWTGPGSPGDFLAVSRPDTAPHRFLDWSPTNVGSPLTLAAPPRPGTYEVRYVTGSGQEILAASPIEIEP